MCSALKILVWLWLRWGTSSHLQIHVAVAWGLLAPLWNILPCNLFCWIFMSNVWFLSVREEKNLKQTPPKLSKQKSKPNKKPEHNRTSSWGYCVYYQVLFPLKLALCRIFGEIFSLPHLYLAGDCVAWKSQCWGILLILMLLGTSEQIWRYRANSLTSMTCVSFDFKIGYVCSKCI